jgi:hypothetical protein
MTVSAAAGDSEVARSLRRGIGLGDLPFRGLGNGNERFQLGDVDLDRVRLAVDYLCVL